MRRSKTALFLKGAGFDKNFLKNSGEEDDEEESSRPEHIDRQPAAHAELNNLLATSTTVDFPTRSEVKPIHMYPPSHTTLKDDFDRARSEAIKNFNQVVAAVDANGGKPFFDRSFFLGVRDNLYPDGSPDDNTVAEPKTIIRAQHAYPGAPLFNKNSNFDVDAEDISQGSTGDCFALAAIASVAYFAKKLHEAKLQNPNTPDPFSDEADSDPIKRLFPAHDIQRSIYAVMFYGVGRWHHVIVDGTLAANEVGELIYAKCREEQGEEELWPMIIEKAYFKFFNSVDNCDGGSSVLAMTTLTGGIQLHVDVDKLKFQKLLELGSDILNVFACGLKREIPENVRARYPAPSGELGQCGEESEVAGLAGGHAYSVLAIKQTTDKKGFMQVKNPWGAGGDATATKSSSSEYQGPFSDKSTLWKTHPTYKQELGFVDKDDGIFFMTAADFRNLMQMEICSFFSDSCQLLTMANCYHKSQINAINDVYILKVDKKCSVRIIIGQYSTRWAPVVLGQNRETHLMAKNKQEWDWETGRLQMDVFFHPKGCPNPKAWGAESSTKKKIASRYSDWSENVFLDVDVHNGYFSIVPDCNPGAPYYVRVVAPADSQCTLFQLSKGLESAAGKTDIKIRVEKPAPGIVHQPAGASTTTTTPTPAPAETTGEQQDIDDDASSDGDDWWDDDEEYEEGEEDWEDDYSDYSDDWYTDSDENEDGGEGGDAWDDYSDYDPENPFYSSSDDDDGDDEDQDGEGELIAGKTVQELRASFDQFDLDGSGFLETDSSEAIACMIHFFPDLSPSVLKKKIKEFDSNNDRKIDFDEFKQIVAEAYEEEQNYDYGNDDDSYDDYE